MREGVQMHRHVLVVEDDRDLRDSLCNALEDEGYTVVGVEHGRAALQHLRAQPKPCLILLDLMMPVMDGPTFRQEQLKDPALADIPVVVITAAGKALASTVHAQGVLHKPFRMDAVVSIIEEYCSPRAPGRPA
jgi:CheY-like chemotaxis protein